MDASRRARREGFVGEALAEFSPLPFQDSGGAAHLGLVAGADLADWTATWKTPATLDFQGTTVAKVGPWNQGPTGPAAMAVLDALGDPGALDPSTVGGVHAVAEALKLAMADGVTRGDTCHVDVVNRWGNMISATPSGGWLQSSPTIPVLGFPLGSRLQMTWLEPGLASSLVAGRRPRSTLSPTMVLREGRPVLAVLGRRPAQAVAAAVPAAPPRRRAGAAAGGRCPT